MIRALVLAALVCVCCSLFGSTEARWTIRPRPTRTTTTSSTTKMTTPKSTTPKLTTLRPRPKPTTTTTPRPVDVDLIVDDGEDYDDRYHPAEVKKPRLIEQFDSRSLDGHYEYRYVLSNGNTRYERAYWLPVGNTKVLARKGYYSYPLPNHEFMTVFYTADHQGYHQDSSTFTKQQPVLPRSLDVPEYEPPKINEQHHKHPRKPNKGHGRKPTQPATKTVSQSDSVEKDENLQDIVVVKATDVVPTATTITEMQQKLRKQHANDVTEFVPATADISEGVEVEEQQQQQQQEQETVGEILQETGAATTVAVEQ